MRRPIRAPGRQDNYVTLGRNSNVQDSSVLHVTPELPCIVGANVTIGHRCVVHACTIMDNVRIGIGAVVLTGAVVEEWAQVGAGALVPQGVVVPAGWLVMGVPAKPVRKMSERELEDIRKNAVDYLNLWQRDYLGNPSGWSESKDVKALEGIRIIDFTQAMAAPFGTMNLADWARTSSRSSRR